MWASTQQVIYSSYIFCNRQVLKKEREYNEVCKQLHVVGPCHHGMARPQVADTGTASDKEGSC